MIRPGHSAKAGGERKQEAKPPENDKHQIKIQTSLIFISRFPFFQLR